MTTKQVFKRLLEKLASAFRPAESPEDGMSVAEFLRIHAGETVAAALREKPGA
jgi:hypothetical protein